MACDVLLTTAAWWHCFLPASASGLLMKEPQANTHVRTLCFQLITSSLCPLFIPRDHFYVWDLDFEGSGRMAQTDDREQRIRQKARPRASRSQNPKEQGRKRSNKEHNQPESIRHKGKLSGLKSKEKVTALLRNGPNHPRRAFFNQTQRRGATKLQIRQIAST